MKKTPLGDAHEIARGRRTERYTHEETAANAAFPSPSPNPGDAVAGELTFFVAGPSSTPSSST